MFTRERCPVCDQTDVAVLDSITPQHLIEAYRSSGLVADTGHLFAQTQQPVLPVPAVQLCRCRSCTLKWYANGPAGDAPFYEALQQHDWYYQTDKPEHHYAAGRLPLTAQVLEVGCGSGAFARHLPPGVRYRGLEFNQTACATARAAGLDVEVRSLQNEVAQRPAAYDVVCHFQVLEHVTAPADFLRQCAQALKPGGLLVVAVPAEDSFYGRAESVWLNMPPHHLTRWTDQALAQAFKQSGVTPTHTWHEPVADYHQSWQRAVAVRAGFQHLRGREPELVTSAGAQKLMNLLKRLPGVNDWLFARALAAYPEMTRGSTVCMFGSKNP